MQQYVSLLGVIYGHCILHLDFTSEAIRDGIDRQGHANSDAYLEMGVTSCKEWQRWLLVSTYDVHDSKMEYPDELYEMVS